MLQKKSLISPPLATGYFPETDRLCTKISTGEHYDCLHLKSKQRDEISLAKVEECFNEKQKEFSRTVLPLIEMPPY